MPTTAAPLPYQPPQMAYTFLGRYDLGADFVVTLDGRTWTVPVGYRTDLATVPRIFWWAIPPTGAYEIAAVLHDWMCSDGIPAGAVTSSDADRIFRQLMALAGVGFVIRWVMWWGVRLGALASRARRPGWFSGGDPWLVAAITVPVVATVLVLLVVAHRVTELVLPFLA